MKGLIVLLIGWIWSMVLPEKAFATDPLTCELKPAKGTATTHQVICHGENIKLSATCSTAYSSLQWYRQSNAGTWTSISGASQTDFTARQGIYKVIFTFWDNSTCETNVDTISYWKAYQIDWEVAACRASISGVTALPFPQPPDDGNQLSEISVPVNPEGEINFSWQIIPASVSLELATSSLSVFPFENGNFTDTTLGLHQVILTVSQQGSSCISVDTMEVTLLPLNVWADTIISYGGEPAIAVAHASGGTEPYQYTWRGADSCLTAGCDQVLLNSISEPVLLDVVDQMGCNATLREIILHEPIRWDVVINVLRVNGLIIKKNLICGKIITNPIIGVGGLISSDSANEIGADPLVDPQIETSKQLISLHEIKLASKKSVPFALTNEGAGVYVFNGDLKLSENVKFIGDSSTLFLVKVSGDLIFNSGFQLELEGVSSNQILWWVKGKLVVNTGANHVGVVYSFGDVNVNSPFQLEGLFVTESSLIFDDLDLNVKIINGKEYSILGESDVCTVVGKNLVCNPGFELPRIESQYVSGPDQLRNVKRWYSLVSSTSDVFNKANPCNSGNIHCYDIPLNYYTFKNTTDPNPGIECRNGMVGNMAGGQMNPPNPNPFCSYIGLHSGSWVGNGQMIEHARQKFVDGSLPKSNRNYLVGFDAVTSKNSAMYCRKFRFDIAGYYTNIETPGLNTSTYWNQYWGVVNTIDVIPNSFLEINGTTQTNSRDLQFRGDKSTFAYTLLDNIFVIEAPTFKKNLYAVCFSVSYNLLVDESYDYEAFLNETNSSLKFRDQYNLNINIPDITNFTPPSYLTKLTAYLERNNDPLIKLQEINFSQQPPPLSISYNAYPFCTGESITFSVVPNITNASYEWVFSGAISGTYFSSSNSRTVTIPASVTTNQLVVQVTVNSGSCSTTKTVNFTVSNSTTIPMTAPQNACAGGSILASVTPPSQSGYYQWSVNGVNQNFSTPFMPNANLQIGSTLQGSISVSLKISQGFQCPVFASKQVDVVNIGNPSLGVPSVICSDQQNFTAVCLNPPSLSNATFIWEINSSQVAIGSNTSVTIQRSQIPPGGNPFQVRLTVTAMGCSKQFVETIYQTTNGFEGSPGLSYLLNGISTNLAPSQNPPPVIIDVCKGTPITFTGNGVTWTGSSTPAILYFWNGLSLSGWTENQIMINTEDLTLGDHSYFLKATSNSGCESEIREVVIRVVPSVKKNPEPACMQADYPVIKVPDYSGSFFLQKPDGSYSTLFDLPLTPALQEGVYHISYSQSDQCLRGSFRILGGSNSSGIYFGTITVKEPAIIVGNITFRNPAPGNMAAFILEEDSKVFALSQGLHFYGNPSDPENEFWGGYVTGTSITLGQRSVLIMKPGSSIQGICGMWGGINATHGSCYFNGLNDNPIEFADSYQGIKLSGSARLLASNVEFKNNMVSVIDNNTIGIPSTITNCLFTGFPSEMKAPFKQTTNGWNDPILSYGWTGIECNRPNFSVLENNTFERLHYGIKVAGVSTDITGLNVVNSTFKDCFLAGVLTKNANVTLQGCTLHYPQKTEKNHQFYREYAVNTNEFLDMESAVEGNFPFGIYFKDGDHGSLTLTGYNLFDGPYQPVNGSVNRYSFLKGNAIRLSSTAVNIQGAQFDKWKQAIRFMDVPPSNGIPHIKASVFNGNARAIEVQTPSSSSLNLDLSCTVFEHHYTDATQTWTFSTGGGVSPIGINILSGGELANVGKYDATKPINERYGPGTNVFPVADGTIRNELPASGDVETGTGHWSSPGVWTSILNGNTNFPKYFRWQNEFLGTRMPNTGLGQIAVELVTKYAIPSNQTPANQDQVQVDCDNFDVSALFPLRMAVVNSVENAATRQKTYLGQSIPNPAGQGEVTIPFDIGEAFTNANVEVFDLATGKVLEHFKVVEQKGSIRFATSQMASGVYGYRLILDGKPVEAKKMVVLK